MQNKNTFEMINEFICTQQPERVTTTNFTTLKFKKNIEKIVTNHYIESLH